jgi:hypothetical protein
MRAGRHYAEFQPILRDRYGSVDNDFADGGVWLGVVGAEFDPAAGAAAIHSPAGVPARAPPALHPPLMWFRPSGSSLVITESTAQLNNHGGY